MGGEEFQSRMRGWVKQIHCPNMMQLCCLWASGCVKKTAVHYALSKTFPGYVRGTVGVPKRNWFRDPRSQKRDLGRFLLRFVAEG